ncbi:MAG: cytochrome c maturation protein CcmE [Anaerolineales bacterium]
MTSPLSASAVPYRSSRTRLWVGGLVLAASVVYLIASSTQASAQYYLTIDELNGRAGQVGDREVRVSGAVEGATIVYDVDALSLRFSMANVPADLKDVEAAGGLAAALHQAVTDPSASRLTVVYIGPKPDLLRDEAQAIVTGRLGEDGVFYAEELLLKCPTRYEESVPAQVDSG